MTGHPAAGNQELAPEELSKLLGGELPPTLPLEGWRTVTVHCQVDAIGPSDRHADLVKVELSFPPEVLPEPCPLCRGRTVVPGYRHLGDEEVRPCPACTVTVRPAVEPSGWVVPLSCPMCGPMGAEPHPRITGVVRCVNCKEHLRGIRVGGEAS